MIEVQFKCQKCGFEAVKISGATGDTNFKYRTGKDLAIDCPVIADLFRQRGQLQGELWAHCPHFRNAAGNARPEAA